MPLYEYHCRECGNDFEELVSLHATVSPHCPSCSSDDTEKKISLFGGISGGSTGGGSCGGGSGFS